MDALLREGWGARLNKKRMLGPNSRLLTLGPRQRGVITRFAADFTYANAHVWYTNMDKLIHHAVGGGRRAAV